MTFWLSNEPVLPANDQAGGLGGTMRQLHMAVAVNVIDAEDS
jgi:hypothetical protein